MTGTADKQAMQKKNYSFLQNQLNYSTDTNYYQSIGGLDIEVFESQLKK